MTVDDLKAVFTRHGNWLQREAEFWFGRAKELDRLDRMGEGTQHNVRFILKNHDALERLLVRAYVINDDRHSDRDSDAAFEPFYLARGYSYRNCWGGAFNTELFTPCDGEFADLCDDPLLHYGGVLNRVVGELESALHEPASAATTTAEA
jgi:hypothetical protein